MAMDHPLDIAGAPILSFAQIEGRCRWTGRCLHHRDGKPLGPSAILAICDSGDLFYLYGCDASWEPLSSTRHPTLEEAKRQAEYEYEGISHSWQTVPGWARSLSRKPSLPASSFSPFQGELLWAGNPYGLSGYAKLNREFCLRISRSVRIRLWAEPAGDRPPLGNAVLEDLDRLRRTELSSTPTLVRAFPPQLERTQDRRVCFTMMETQTVHPDFVRRLNHGYHECWTPTEWNKETFQRSGVRIPVSVIPLGIDPDVFRPGPRVPLPPGELLTTRRAGSKESPQGFIFVTTYQPTFRKGVDLLFEAFDRAFEDDDEVALVLATTAHSYGALEESLRRRETRTRVYGMTGRFSETGLADLYRGSNAYVTASLGEGWNLPLCEAAACGLPVIAGRHSAHAELFGDETAYFFDPEGFAPVSGSEEVSPWYKGQAFARFGATSRDHLVELLKEVRNRPSISEAKGRRAAQEIRSRFTWDLAAERALARLRESDCSPVSTTGTLATTMKARHIEFGGGLGDVLTRIYNSSSYSELEDLSPNEEATVVLMSHNPHAKELFSWHPKASQLEIRDVGFWWPNEDLAMRAVHGLPPAPPVHLARQESVRFHPSPADQLILQELGPAPYIVLNAGAGSPDRNVPNSICNDALSAISEKWLKNHSMRAIAVGRTYTRERRVEPRFPAREGFVDLIDQLSVPGTIELIRGSAGVFCCHSALCLVAWYLNKPVFLTYPKHVGSREIDPPSHQYNLGKDRPSTIHLEFKRYTRGEFERFLDVVEKAMRS